MTEPNSSESGVSGANEPTVGEELAKNRAMQTLHTILLGGVGGLLVMGNSAADHFKLSQGIDGWFYLCLIVAAASFGRSYGGVITAERQLKTLKGQDGKALSEESVISDGRRYAHPVDAKFWYVLGWIAMAASIVLLLTVVWSFPLKPTA